SARVVLSRRAGMRRDGAGAPRLQWRLSVTGGPMAPNATIYRVELQVSDMDRHYYASHVFSLAQHPSETQARLMVRLLAFALFADERLEFGRGLSTAEDPDLWQRAYTCVIEPRIDLGHTDESRVRKASARARDVVVVTYGGNASDVWWKKTANALARLDNLTVIDIEADDVDAVTGLLERSMRLTAMIQDGELQLMSDRLNVAITPKVRKAAR